ncbi:D-lyxose/D-mannose family sugar isomerase [candidate division KSB1 bacterium]|nr:D-lyxose/D-mannose family sugar isomerase [candidate division KSB1 bacterium]
MIHQDKFTKARKKAARMIRRAGIRISEKEANIIHVIDFGLGNLLQEGLQVLTLYSSDRIEVRVLVLLPNQIYPEHWHPVSDSIPGKEETIRVIDGSVRLYLPGELIAKPSFIPEGKEKWYTSSTEVTLNPGEQLTIAPAVKYWIKAEQSGSVMYSFSAAAPGISDQFSDPNIQPAI